jgi:hypothetical protein
MVYNWVLRIVAMAARGRQWSFAYCRHGGAGQAKELCRLSSWRRVEMKGLSYKVS